MDKAKIQKPQRIWLFALFAIAWCSGVAFFILKTWFIVEGEFNIDVLSVNDSPIITSIPIDNILLGDLFEYNIRFGISLDRLLNDKDHENIKHILVTLLVSQLLISSLKSVKSLLKPYIIQILNNARSERNNSFIY